MSYADTAALVIDSAFQGRLQAVVTSESRGRLPGSSLAVSIMEAPLTGMTLFMPWVTSEPGFDVPEPMITDSMLLAATQAVWAQVAAQVAGIT